MSARPRVLVVVGARPNFMKAGPVCHALERRGRVDVSLVHTGQHYDERMSDLFFRELGLPEPAVNLEVGSGTHAAQTAEIMQRFERHLLGGSKPAMVVVVGDVNSTLACALVAAKDGIAVGHVEAGLRSFDRTMPEEINRILTDQLADVCWVTERSGMEHLRREGKPDAACVLAGNAMIDTLLRHRERARGRADALRRELGVAGRPYAVCTLHRPSNVDDRDALAGILDALAAIARRVPILWPVHPRFVARSESFGFARRLEGIAGLRTIPPQGYLDFLALMDGAALLLTDSGGIQEEACVLKVPCVTLRDNTERPATLETGGNVLAGNRADRVVAAAERMLSLDRATIGTPELWDGQAGERIAADLERRLERAER